MPVPSDTKPPETQVKRRSKGGNPNWVKGVSGNPSGVSKTTAGLVRQIRETERRYAPAVIEAVRVAALGGDMAAARIYLERVLGPPSMPEDAVDAQSLVKRVVVEYQRPVVESETPQNCHEPGGS